MGNEDWSRRVYSCDVPRRSRRDSSSLAHLAQALQGRRPLAPEIALSPLDAAAIAAWLSAAVEQDFAATDPLVTRARTASEGSHYLPLFSFRMRFKRCGLGRRSLFRRVSRVMPVNGSRNCGPCTRDPTGAPGHGQRCSIFLLCSRWLRRRCRQCGFIDCSAMENLVAQRSMSLINEWIAGCGDEPKA